MTMVVTLYREQFPDMKIFSGVIFGAAVSMASLNYITAGGSRIKKEANSICSNVFSIGIPYDDTVGQKLNAGIIDGKRD